MIYRIDVWGDKQGTIPSPVVDQARQNGVDVSTVRENRVYFVETDADAKAVERVADVVLADPISDTFQIVTAPYDDGDGGRIEVHFKPGVMDPTASSATMALTEAGLAVKQVRTGRAYRFDRKLTEAEGKLLAARVLANGVVESVFFETHLPTSFAVAAVKPFELRRVPLRDLDDTALATLSRQGHLFLNVVEMRAVRDYFVEKGREPTDIELETVAQTWSEHCVHKTLKSRVEVFDEAGTPLRQYGNLIKETIFASTMELMARRDDGFCLSVFKDNAGVIAFDATDAVCFKVETHNRPSAIEPYGGAATGIGGCIRDVLGTGLGAKPIANTNVFCVAYPKRSSNVDRRLSKKDGSVDAAIDNPQSTIDDRLPPGVIHPKRVLQQVVAGVRDYGNRMGIPTVNGAVYFDENYVGNPLVFAGCIGLIPNDKITKQVHAGDAIVVMGGRTGRDGIHGATFSSAEISSTAADEFSHAVQIGNAIEQKRMMDVLLQARDAGLYSALTDCGAGGLSSAIGEMGADVGANVTLDTVPLKYDGLRYDEIWISEAQERMVLSVPQENVAALLAFSKGENVEATVIGTFGTENAELILNYHGTEVGRVAMHFLHDGIPMPTRKAIVDSQWSIATPSLSTVDYRPSTFSATLLKSLAHPNIASKHWIIRQYDHEVQGGSVIKPLIGPKQIGPSDAAVVRPKLNSSAGVIAACGLAPAVSDPYKMAVAAIDEAIRNAVCVGADVDKLAILDNFCWPGTDDERAMGQLVRACEACRDAALAFGVPFISGKDSLHNQFTDKSTGRVIKIPATLLISAIGVIDDVARCVTMDFKNKNSRVVLIRANDAYDLATLNTLHRTMSGLIRGGRFSAVHDVSDGGYAVAAAEMCIASGLGLIASNALLDSAEAFAERPGAYVAELRSWETLPEIASAFAAVAEVVELGITQGFKRFTLTTEQTHVTDIAVDDLTKAWRGTLDW